LGLHRDITGQCGPLTLIRLAMAARGRQPGAEVRSVGNDPVFERAVRDCCASHGRTVLEVAAGERLRVTVYFGWGAAPRERRAAAARRAMRAAGHGRSRTPRDIASTKTHPRAPVAGCDDLRRVASGARS
jgi:hypothetical protein